MTKSLGLLSLGALLVACGAQAEESGSRTPITGVTMPTTVRSPASTQSSGSDSIVPARSDDIPGRVARAFLSLTRTPVSAVADYLVQNRTYRRTMADCLAAAGFAEVGYDLSDPPITPAMLDGFRMPISWPSPPTGILAAPATPDFLQPTDPAAIGWTPAPFPSPEEEAKFAEAHASCEGSATFETKVDWNLINELLADADLIVESSRKQPEFAKLLDAYRTCAQQSDAPFTSPEEADQFGANPRPDLDVVGIDDRCRTPLYARFIQLSFDQWNQWLSDRAADLAALDANWLALQREAGFPV